jgi:Uma2 family endonuclease
MYDYPVPKPSREKLPTMYDLPSEDPEESGLPDEFHPVQSQLLSDTFKSPVVRATDIFIGTDINLYYDSRHTQWYKRPDWFLVLGAARSATVEEMRWSYVIWQESVPPFLVVELLSEGTEDEDLGQTLRVVGKPPTKWQVYEQVLRVPYYVLFDRVMQQLQAFRLNGSRYEALSLRDERLWLDEVQLGVGVWEGEYGGAAGRWLRWYDGANAWVPTPDERADQEQQRADQEQQRAEAALQRAEQLAEQLRSLGIDPDEV